MPTHPPGDVSLLTPLSISAVRSCPPNTTVVVSDVTGLHFQAAVPKYLRLEMQPASGSVVKAGGAEAVEQVVRITNSLQVCTKAMDLGRPGEEGGSGVLVGTSMQAVDLEILCA